MAELARRLRVPSSSFQRELRDLTAAGTEDHDSDVDLIVVGQITPADLALPLRAARNRLGRPVNPTVYTPAEFAAGRASADHFLTRVLDRPKRFVIGNANGLDPTARRQAGTPRRAKRTDGSCGRRGAAVPSA